MVHRMVNAIGWSGWPVLLIGLALMFLEPALEEKFFPIRTDQSMQNIVRTEVHQPNNGLPIEQLCWEWVSRKRRAAVSDNLDLWIETPGDRSVGAPYERDTGYGWARSRAKPASAAVLRQPYCVLLPPSTRMTDTVRVTQVAYYPSLVPGLHVLVHMPDVISPGLAGP